VLGVALLCTIGGAQWHEGQGLAYGIAVGVVAGVVMATFQAAVTGWGLVRLLGRSDRSREGEPLARSAA